jgi:hypothetical protein
VGSVPRDATSRMVKDEYLQGMIRSTRFVYARQLKTAWDDKYWDRESSKTSRTKQLVDVLDFHESRMIHGRLEIIISNVYCFFIAFHPRCVRV